MLQIAVIIFREILEIALIISILAAATKGIKNRHLYIWGGVLLGTIGSGILALFTDSLKYMLAGHGEELFKAIIIAFAAAMISYTVIWMKQHGQKLSKNLKSLGKKVKDGEKSMMAVLLITTITVLREGAEIVLFSYSYILAGNSVMQLAIGSSLGFAIGSLVGILLYFGLLKFFGKYFFTITTWLLVFLAAGMVAASLKYLALAGIIPPIIYPVWDSSGLLDQESLLGEFLHVIIGYVAKPSLTQLLGYLTTILFLFFGIKQKKTR